MVGSEILVSLRFVFTSRKGTSPRIMSARQVFRYFFLLRFELQFRILTVFSPGPYSRPCRLGYIAERLFNVHKAAKNILEYGRY